RTLIHNATPLSKLSSLLGTLNGVLLAPEDRALIKGGPALRRQFFDLLISQAKPLYLHHLTRYLRAMKQRNSLLKKRVFTAIEAWEEQMALSATALTHMRAETLIEIERLGQTETLGTDRLQLHYSSAQASTQEAHMLTHFFLKQFAKQRPRECELGTTLSGPHRDDFSILLNEREARQFASEGEQRSLVAALKFAQWKWLESLVDTPPILCLDDLSLSFDRMRESALYQRLEKFGQTFITMARPPSSPHYAIHIQNLCSA
ncbi:MAG: DNA replication and repair protein RecF, partial [Chlamydiia bacterium]|nr:DNA replication and repair protein RecF [Chlamydiia bacterium]